MANEFKYSIAVNYKDGVLTHNHSTGTIQVDSAAPGIFSRIVSVTTNNDGITISGLTDQGFARLLFVTTGTTERIYLHNTTAASGRWGELRAKEAILYRMSSTAGGSQLRAVASAGSHKLQVTVFEA